MTDSFEIDVERADDAAQIETVLTEAFGPGRFAKTAYRLREGVEHLPELAFVARNGAGLVGSIRYWPITITREGKPDHSALLLGPLAVVPAMKGKGVGNALMERSIQAAKEAGHQTIILVGDEGYYARQGFSGLACFGLKMPGPVDPTRLLGLDLAEPVLDGTSGYITKG